MLLHELSCPIGGLLLSVLMLKDAGRNYYAVAGVDPVVSHESRHFADDGHKALLHNRYEVAHSSHYSGYYRQCEADHEYGQQGQPAAAGDGMVVWTTHGTTSFCCNWARAPLQQQCRDLCALAHPPKG